MIEIQKANKASDIFRFKRYISINFQRKHEKEINNPLTQAVEKIKKPIRLIPIFILNFSIENEINDLIIKTDHVKIGIFKEKKLKKENKFIDNLIYNIWVIQLPNLNKIKKSDYQNNEYKTKLYSLLKLFDQDAQNKKNSHKLLLIKKIFPGFLERIINRLKSADKDNPDLEEQMNAEDEYLAELIKRDNEISYFKQVLEKTTDKLEKKSTELEKEKQISKEKDKEVEFFKLEFAKILKDKGTPTKEIQQKTNLSKEIIDKL